MMLRTHYAITACFVLLLLPSVSEKVLFVVIAFFATQLPDIDARYSRIGQKKIARVLQWFTRHRGMIHSFTFLFSLILLFLVFWPQAALGFFLGYGLHLFSDSFTKDGIMPFYPSQKKAKGSLRTGGRMEVGLFVGLVIADLFLLVDRISVIF